MEEWLEILLKLIISLGASGLIGLEREITGHKAGIRTQILVGIGSTSLVMLGFYSVIEMNEIARIIAGIATGLGFLGAGAIIKEGLNVKGLTTAATIWVNAGIGASIGMGEYLIGLSALVITLLVLSVFAFIEKVLHLKPRGGTFEIKMPGGKSSAIEILDYLESKGINIRGVDIRMVGHEEILRFEIDFKRRSSVFKVIKDVHHIHGIKEIRWEDADQVVGEGFLG
jgi:putative Mg2+ transporter-C (MgtC) family protein